ncbi:deleted in malignant brain tumors 1 protein-like [Branchiostoma floridae]|uniref:Deleted in malignant brain tumors 1 protein-like n=1 Tax=Branchiostoma floridae TaxID=7739 RepID=A0A9J7HG36_BRAFL|nr:deleted in malignant brain tumors 1 protein-like [Branchiostoma floridae]
MSVTPITGTSNQLFLRFSSDESVVAQGFHFSYTATDTTETTIAPATSAPGCGGILAAPPGGTVTSPNYPGNYGNDETCEWTITVPEGSVVRLTFDSFSLETGYDYLMIYDGGSDGAPPLRRLTGYAIPDPITSTSNQMFVKFTSDYSSTAQGFQFSYTATGPTTTTSAPGCGGILTAPPGGTVTSPNYPNYYPNSATCEWKITVPEGSVVLLTFDSFQLDYGYDYLTIYDGGSDSAPRLQRLIGHLTPDPITSTSNQMFVRFTSDHSYTFQGFQFSYTATAAIYGSPSEEAVNVAQGKTAYQTSTKGYFRFWEREARLAVDGNTNGDWWGNSCTCTRTEDEDNPAWWVDLGQSYVINSVVIFNRLDCCSDRLNPFNIHIGGSSTVTSNPKCGGDHRIDLSQPSISVSCQGMTGRYVGVRLIGFPRVMSLCEVQVFSTGPITEVPTTLRHVTHRTNTEGRLQTTSMQSPSSAQPTQRPTHPGTTSHQTTWLAERETTTSIGTWYKDLLNPTVLIDNLAVACLGCAVGILATALLCCCGHRCTRQSRQVAQAPKEQDVEEPQDECDKTKEIQP